MALISIGRPVSFVLLGFALAVGGCSGGGAGSCVGGDQVCPVLITSYLLQPSSSWRTPDAPIAIGASVDVAFTEQTCKSSSNSRQPLPGTGCGASYAPSQLVVSALPLSDGTACPITGVVVSPGTLRFTRTAPGDPRLRAGSAGLPGYCAVDVNDPGHSETVVVL